MSEVFKPHILCRLNPGVQPVQDLEPYIAEKTVDADGNAVIIQCFEKRDDEQLLRRISITTEGTVETCVIEKAWAKWADRKSDAVVWVAINDKIGANDVF